MIDKLLTFVVLAIGISKSTYSDVDYQSLSKDLEIMENILQTALSQKDDKKAICFQSINTIYLAEQGVLFEISTAGSRSHYGSMFHSLGQFIPPIPPMPAIEFHSGGENHIVGINVDMEDTERYVKKIEAMAEEFERSVERHQDILGVKREVEWELKEKKRRLKERNFELSRAENRRKKTLESDITQLEKDIASLSERAEKLALEKQQHEAAQREKITEKREFYKNNVNEFFTHFENVVSETLCRYGSGLKFLPVDEKVTFRVKDLGYIEDEPKKKKHDKVYVFSKKSLKDCVDDKINPRQFMGEAHKYIY